jgi:hypothetical protein
MNLEFVHLLPADFSPNSRVWIYQSNRLFSLSEALDIEVAINEFCEEWTSHGAEVNAFGNLFFGQFVVLMTDETAVGVSGCSTDSSVRFIKELGNRYHVDFLELASINTSNVFPTSSLLLWCESRPCRSTISCKRLFLITSGTSSS